MTQWLKAIVALAEDLGSVSSTYIMAHKHLMLSTELCGHQACTCRKLLIYMKIKINKSLKKNQPDICQ